MQLWMAPFFLVGAAIQWLYETIVALAPIIGISIATVSAIAGVLSVVVLVFAARVLVHAERRWVRVVGRILIGIEIVATLAFIGLAVIASAAVAIYA